MTVKQAHAQLFFEHSDLTAQGWLRNTQPVGCFGQTAQFGGMNDGAKL